MISKFKFFSELNFLLKNGESFVAFKKPSHDKIVCQQGDIFKGKISEMSGKRGFLFMPFDTREDGFLMSPKTTIETEFHLDMSKIQNVDISIKEFDSKKKSYVKYIKNTISYIQDSGLEKVVCSSSFKFKINSKLLIEYFKSLLQLNHDAFCYLFYHPEIGIWLGATPEKLINLNNHSVTTFALAATKKKADQSWNDKEFTEHKIVEDQIVSDLNNYCTNIEIGALQTIKAGNIFHLKSVIKAKTNNFSSELIKVLHPTPAVAGMPKNKAVNRINKTENYDRSFYTGYLGQYDKKSCDIYVNIRCAKVVGDNLTVYVGGGITKDSNASDEWNEIVNKSQTMLAVFHSS